MDTSQHFRAVPLPPTSSLTPLGRLYTQTPLDIQKSLDNLKLLYFPSAHNNPPRSTLKVGALEPGKPFSIPMPFVSRRKGLLGYQSGQSSVPDSGYASCEEEDVKEDAGKRKDGDGDDDNDHSSDTDGNDDLEILRSDQLERAFAIKWLTGFVARFEEWAAEQPTARHDDDEGQDTQVLFDMAVSLLSDFAGGDEEDEVALTRKFSFPFRSLDGAEDTIEVELNDAPLSKEDHTSVGLQSWGSAILFAQRFCVEPDTFIPPRDPTGASASYRVLELGAGTGMLSIVAAKVLRRRQRQQSFTRDPSLSQVVATDYHPSVLENLLKNIKTNFPSQRHASAASGPNPNVLATSLDWETPHLDEAPFNQRFDVILAADVVYHPSHAAWIKSCVENLLEKPHGVFWLIIPIRSTGRHEGIDRSVDENFPLNGDSVSAVAGVECPTLSEGDKGGDEREMRLVTLVREDIERQTNIGRMDEGGYRLFKIGWV